MLHHPALGGQLVARLCAADEGAPELEDLTDLLGAGLDAARMARENRKKRGDAFLKAVEEAVGLAAGQGALGPTHRLVLARVWARNGLQAPAALEFAAENLETSELAVKPRNRAEADAMLDNLFQDLLQKSGGDAPGLHAALSETFPAMPADFRDHVVEYLVTRPEPVHAQLGCFWLLAPSPSIRRAAAEGLAERLEQGMLTSEITANLVVLRSWMPEDGARKRVDQLLRAALRSGVAMAAPAAPWTVHGIMATLPDGGGAQSIGIALQSGSSRKVAMLLLKQEHGVKQGNRVWTSRMLNQEHIANETIALVAFGGCESRSKTSTRPVRSICDSPVG